MIYETALEMAARLWGDTPNEGPASEYLRGMAELLGDLFPVPGESLGERAAEIAMEIIRRGKDGA